MATSQSEHSTPGTTTARRSGAARIARSLGLPLAFALPYMVLLVWFHGVDVYHRHFSEPGLVVFFYNGFRVLFIFYLFWMVEAAGLLLLRAVARNELAEAGSLERLALGFFAGTGLWHVTLFALGYLDLYTVPVAIAITLPMVMLSYADLRAAVRDIYRAVATGDTVAQHFEPRILGWFAIALAGAAFLTLLLVKGLYPGGGGDYFTHYFYYYEAVVEHHGLWPNEVWYHYFYDKGAGLFFLGMVIADPLAPQLITFCFMAAATLAVFLASRSAAPDTSWPWVAVLLFLVIFLYTPGWGEFEKSHELTTALVIASLWSASGAFARCGTRQNTLWPVAAASSIATAVIITPTIAIFMGAVFGILWLYYLLAGDRRRTGLSFLFAAINGVLLLAGLAINYATTGLFSDQVLVAAWPFSNLEKIYQWGALPIVIGQYWGFIDQIASRLPLSQVAKLLSQSSRLDLIYPFIGGGLAVGAAALAFRLRTGRRAGSVHAPHQAAILLLAVPVFVAIALTSGRIQPISFYRYAGFAVPLMLVGAAGLWRLPVSGVDSWYVRLFCDRRMPAAVLALSLLTFAAATPPARFFDTWLPHALRFAAGSVSIDTAYTLQPTSNPLFPVNAIHPGARGAYSVVGPSIPIWSFHTQTYCMLPDCRVESIASFILPGWVEAMYDRPESGRRALAASGHNYFLFSRELPIADTLPLSPLFSPDTIARYMGIRWTDGTTTLLTWIGPGVEQIDAAWLAEYRHAVEQSIAVQTFPNEAMRQVFARLRAMPHPWHPFPLPWSRH
jgi:hypothetical protein